MQLTGHTLTHDIDRSLYRAGGNPQAMADSITERMTAF